MSTLQTAAGPSGPSQNDAARSQTAEKLAQDALAANKRLHEALAHRAAALEAELNEADRLLALVANEDVDDDSESDVWIPGAKKAVGPFLPSQLLGPNSPFYEEARRRSTYIANTNPRPMKAKDIEVLTEAVRKENERLQAYRSRELNSPDGNGLIDAVNNVDGIDWSKIAERVSDTSTVKRNAVECRVAWLGNYHPSINHAEWSKNETDDLNTIVRDLQTSNEKIDWVATAKKLGTNRTPFDCMKHVLPRSRFKWTHELDDKLEDAVKRFGFDNWHQVARHVADNVTGLQCQNRWTKSLDPSLRLGPWSKEEDNQLRKAVAGYGTSWMQVASIIPGRTNDQCRARWLEHLSLSEQDLTWTEQDDKTLLEAAKEVGKHWKVISLKVGGKKTGPNCRLRYEKLMNAQKQKPSSTPDSSTFSAVPNLVEGGPVISIASTSSVVPSLVEKVPATSNSSTPPESAVPGLVEKELAIASASTAPLAIKSVFLNNGQQQPNSEQVPPKPAKGPPKPRPIGTRRSARTAQTQPADGAQPDVVTTPVVTASPSRAKGKKRAPLEVQGGEGPTTRSKRANAIVSAPTVDNASDEAAAT